MRGESPDRRTLYGALRPWAQAVIIAAAGAVSLARYRSLPSAEPALPMAGEAEGALTSLPLVSIIIPARNEERNLRSLLESLSAQEYPAFEVIVVDDDSSDGTGAIAEEFAADDARVRVIRSGGPKAGWTGKTRACWLGAQAARGEWLLFTDADTQHAPSALRSAISLALNEEAHALSLFAQQRCETFWERLLLPFAYQQYFVGTRIGALRQAYGPALANGQYFLISRAAYTASGGHGAIADSVIDDVALAGALKWAGYHTLVAHGESLVSVRMYDSLGAVIEGFTKNAFQFLQAQRGAGALVALSTAASAATLPALLTAGASKNRLGVAGAAAAYGAQMALVAPWARDFGVPRRYALLTPFAALVFTGIALSSCAHALLGLPVRWKGRALAPNGAIQPRNPHHR